CILRDLSSGGEFDGHQFVGIGNTQANAARGGLSRIPRRDFGHVGVIQFQVEHSLSRRAAHLHVYRVEEGPPAGSIVIRREHHVLARFPRRNSEGAAARESSSGAAAFPAMIPAVIIEQRVQLLLGGSFSRACRGHGRIERMNRGFDFEPQRAAIARPARRPCRQRDQQDANCRKKRIERTLHTFLSRDCAKSSVPSFRPAPSKSRAPAPAGSGAPLRHSPARFRPGTSERNPAASNPPCRPRERANPDRNSPAASPPHPPSRRKPISAHPSHGNKGAPCRPIPTELFPPHPAPARMSPRRKRPEASTMRCPT